MLDHIYPKDWEEYLNGINRVLKKDGFLAITEFSAKDARITDLSKNFNDGVNYDHFFREDEINQLFGGKYDIMQIQDTELHTTSHFAMISVLMKKR